MGAWSFAGRARRELTATGATAHSQRNATLDELTPQEAATPAELPPCAIAPANIATVSIDFTAAGFAR
jgi:hypothetical protein